MKRVKTRSSAIKYEHNGEDDDVPLFEIVSKIAKRGCDEANYNLFAAINTTESVLPPIGNQQRRKSVVEQILDYRRKSCVLASSIAVQTESEVPVTPVEITGDAEKSQAQVMQDLRNLIKDSPNLPRATPTTSLLSPNSGNPAAVMSDIVASIPTATATVVPPAPPPPPPPPPMASGFGMSGNNNSSNNSCGNALIKPHQPPKYKNCPITLVSCNPQSVFAEIDLLNAERFEALIGQAGKDSLNSFSIAPPPLSLAVVAKPVKDSSNPRRDSGFDSEGEEEEGNNDIKTAATPATALPPKKVKAISVLDERRSHTLDLSLRQVRMPVEQLINAVLDMNLTRISAKTASILQKYIPTDSEVMALQPYMVTDTTDISQTQSSSASLCEPDRYMLMVSGIPDYGLRLKCIEFSHEYVDQAIETSQSIDLMHEACQQLLADNQGLKEFLRLAHGLACFMNQGRTGWNSIGNQHSSLSPQKSTSKGFRIKDILRLTEVKENGSGRLAGGCFGGINKRHTLFETLVRLSRDRGVGNFADNWTHINRARQLKDLSFHSTKTMLKRGVESLELLLEQSVDTLSLGSLQVLREHLKQAQYYYSLICSSASAVREDFIKVLLRFNDVEPEEVGGGKMLPRSPEEFFGDVAALVEELKRANQLLLQQQSL